MGKKLVYRDPLTGKETWRHDEPDGGFIFESVSPIDDIIKNNKAQEAEYSKGSLIGNTQRHHQKVAEIPSALYHKLIQELGQPKDNPKAWRKWLNDYDNRVFRTGGGNI